MICIEVIKKGTTEAEAVKAVKVRLNACIKSNLDIHNGNFGLDTEAAVRLFQKQQQLLADGVVNQLTWERLFTVRPKVKITATELRTRALEIANTQLFVREKTGKNDGVEVEAYLKSTGLGKGYAWCMAFVFWAFSKAATDLKIPNLMPKTAGVLDGLRRSKKYVVLKPMPGDIFIMDFGDGKGHAGFVEEIKGDYIYTVEGNTSADPSYKAEDREGNGVFERRRAISTIKAFIRYV